MKIKHLVITLEGCRGDLLTDKKLVCSILNKIADAIGMKIIRKLSYKFNPGGISVIYLLAESHIAFHSWPEIRLADIEIVSCKEDSDMSKGLEVVIAEFKPVKIHKKFWEYRM